MSDMLHAISEMAVISVKEWYQGKVKSLIYKVVATLEYVQGKEKYNDIFKGPISHMEKKQGDDDESFQLLHSTEWLKYYVYRY